MSSMTGKKKVIVIFLQTLTPPPCLEQKKNELTNLCLNIPFLIPGFPDGKRVHRLQPSYFRSTQKKKI